MGDSLTNLNTQVLTAKNNFTKMVQTLSKRL